MHGYNAAQVGGIAQLVERLHGMQEVSGSIPLISTRVLNCYFLSPFVFISLSNLGLLFWVAIFFSDSLKLLIYKVNQWIAKQLNRSFGEAKIIFDIMHSFIRLESIFKWQWM